MSILDNMPTGVHPVSMTHEDFDIFMQNALEAWRKYVKEHPDYEFARNGERIALGDWFEQFATSTGVM